MEPGVGSEPSVLRKSVQLVSWLYAAPHPMQGTPPGPNVPHCHFGTHASNAELRIWAQVVYLGGDPRRLGEGARGEAGREERG